MSCPNLGNYKKIPEVIGTDRKVHSQQPKKQVLTVGLQNCEKSAVKDFLGKPMLLNFVEMSIIFCRSLE